MFFFARLTAKIRAELSLLIPTDDADDGQSSVGLALIQPWSLPHFDPLGGRSIWGHMIQGLASADKLLSKGLENNEPPVSVPAQIYVGPWYSSSSWLKCM